MFDQLLFPLTGLDSVAELFDVSYGFGTLCVLFAVALALTGWQGFLFAYGSGNLITLQMAQEMILLAIGIQFTIFGLAIDDLVGSNITLYLLPLAGAESAVALALLIAYCGLWPSITIR